MPDSTSQRRALEAAIYLEDRLLTRCLIRRGRYVIGQERKNEIVLDEPSISRTHARLTLVSDDEIYIEDLDSENGTFVDGQAAQGETRVLPGSEIRLGATTLCLQRAGLPAAIFQDMPPGFLRARRYNFGEIVVQGSTSTIYEAHDTSINREVACKVMLPTSQRHPAAVLRFVREAQITGQLDHPGILPIYELALDEQNRLFLTTRFIEAESLAQILDRLAAGDEETVAGYTLGALLGIWQKACDAVAFAHSRGVVHGTLKPEAIEVGKFGEVFVTSWTLAKLLPAEEGDTARRVQAPEATWTPELSHYASPEQAAGHFDDIDPRTDVHALGGVLYRIITLRDPLQGDTEDALLEAALSSRVTPLAELPKDSPRPHWARGRVPDFPAAVAMKALSYERDDRHASVPELQREIAAWQEGTAAGADLGKIWKQFTGLLGQR
ncbi:MAG: eukaryotic-like serine/threonine-protein kinase [Chthoniobacter sp.]|jgi:hypothetical protein|nr:eukaryotic-like serine/threonine-protein kinase [Chthoniobacter sp.]